MNTAQLRIQNLVEGETRWRLTPRQCLKIASDITGVVVTYAASISLKFDFHAPLEYREIFVSSLPLLVAVYLLVFALFRLHNTMWSYFGAADLIRMSLALTTAGTAIAIVLSASSGWTAGLRSILLLQLVLMAAWMSTARLAARILREHRTKNTRLANENDDRILIVGKLSHADIVIRAGQCNHFGEIVGLVTNDPAHAPLTLHSVPILGSLSNVGAIARVNRANTILILPPFTGRNDINGIIANCVFEKHPCKYRLIPSLADLASGQVKASSIREVEIDDLLGRSAVQLDGDLMYRFIWNRRVLVTGAGGSIGSQICRQVARFKPSVLVLFEMSEIALFSITNELRSLFPDLNLIARIGDIRYPEQIAAAIDDAGGMDVIYHAAAYKHVFLMEKNVPAAFQTNVLGTARLARVAADKGVERFVMISSDKAVRPTSIMGATKRIAERIIHEFPPGRTKFVSVRFGNVLDSSGSVIPIFREQIANGGPITVTSENVRRFFMSIPEAVDLVLMAGTLGQGGDIMVLDMGEPVKIIDLAKRMIELSGLVPGEDIPIEIIGLRPGEKEFEEVMTADEDVVPSPIDRISLMRKNPVSASKDAVDLRHIAQMIVENDATALREIARELVSENQFQKSPVTALTA